ncbi:MAG: tRNA-dihydrouridine synthase family protein [Bacteroidales bacterium]|nr:tRNA-dihydrouridine synthase family protein [Bacteroidales bacterium]
MEKELHFAPMQGYADHLYRRFHAEIYGGADWYYTPFIRIEKGAPRHQDMARLDTAQLDGTPTVPQIIFKSVDEFDHLTRALRDRGWKRIDLNLGCPYPMQTRRGRGAAVISNLPLMEQIGERISADPDCRYSIKMRVGMAKPDEWRALMPTLNSLPLDHITLHPRIASQLYGGELYEEEAREFIAESKNPVIWNGDLLSPEDINRVFEAYPQLKGAMVGRGFLARPSLGAEWRSAQEWDHDKRMDYLYRFHTRLLAAYESTLCGQAQILQKIKPFWEYLEPEIGHRAAKALHKAGSLARYQSAVTDLFK